MDNTPDARARHAAERVGAFAMAHHGHVRATGHPGNARLGEIEVPMLAGNLLRQHKLATGRPKDLQDVAALNRILPPLPETPPSDR